MADKLLPCPFCGGEGKYHGSYFEDDVCEYVSCTRCNASTPLMYKKGESIEWWNRRPSPWRTGTPTEEGWYLVKYQCVLEGKYKGRLSYRTIKRYKDKIDNFIYEEGGIGHDDVWMPIEYQKIDDLWEGN